MRRRMVTAIIGPAVSLIAGVLLVAVKVGLLWSRAVRPKTAVATAGNDANTYRSEASRADVSAFLDERKIEHSYVAEVRDAPEKIG